jgi:hypothetical protein
MLRKYINFNIQISYWFFLKINVCQLGKCMKLFYFIFLNPSIFYVAKVVNIHKLIQQILAIK